MRRAHHPSGCVAVNGGLAPLSPPYEATSEGRLCSPAFFMAPD